MNLFELLVSTRVAIDVVTAVLLKGTVLISFAALASLFARSRSASTRHAIWTAALIGVGALPVIEVVGPGWSPLPTPIAHYPAETALVGLESIEVTRPDADLPVVADVRGSGFTSAPDVLPLSSVLLLLWWAGVLAAGTRIATNTLRVRWLRSSHTPVDSDTELGRLFDMECRCLDVRRRVGLGIVQHDGLAATVGWRRPLVLLGPDVAELPHESLRSVLVHELAHVRRHDALTHHLTSAALALAWANPLAWLARGRLIREREQACDDRVLGHGVFASDYARVLLAFAATGAALGPALRGSIGLRFCATKHRLDAVLDPTTRRDPSRPWSTAIVTLAFLGTTLGIGTLDLVASAPGSGSTTDLVAALSHDEPSVRAQAARTLGRRCPDPARVELETLLDDPVADVRLAAIGALERLADPASVPAFAHVLERAYDGGRGEHGYVLKLAIVGLGKIGSPEAARVLEDQLDRPVEQLRWLALETLMGIPGQEAATARYLESFAANDTSERNRRLAAERLAARE